MHWLWRLHRHVSHCSGCSQATGTPLPWRISPLWTSCQSPGRTRKMVGGHILGTKWNILLTYSSGTACATKLDNRTSAKALVCNCPCYFIQSPWHHSSHPKPALCQAMPRHFGASMATDGFPLAGRIKFLFREYEWRSSASGCNLSHTCMPPKIRNKPSPVWYSNMCISCKATSSSALLVISEHKNLRRKTCTDAADQKS